jgi:hypothetical protein
MNIGISLFLPKPKPNLFYTMMPVHGESWEHEPLFLCVQQYLQYQTN